MVPQQKTCGNGHWVFFRGFFRQPALIGSVIPSSRFLERRIVEAAGIAHSRMVVELGPGTGGTTRAILRALPRRAHLLAIEINPEFVNYLKAYPDPRLDVYLGSAEHAQGSGNLRPYPAGRYRVRHSLLDDVGRNWTEDPSRNLGLPGPRGALRLVPVDASGRLSGTCAAGRSSRPVGASQYTPPAGFLVAQARLNPFASSSNA